MRRFHERRDELGINQRTGLAHVSQLVRPVIDGQQAGLWGQHAVQVTHSPIEALLEDLFVKYLDPATRKTTQRTVSTPFGRFRPDFYLVSPCTGRVLVIECDGREFHDPLRDRWRDAAMLGCGVVHDLLRVEGKDLKRRPHDVLYLLWRLFPELFLKRARSVLEKLVSPEAQVFSFSMHGAATIYYRPPTTAFAYDGDEPVDDPMDDVPFGVHRESDFPPGEYDDFLNFDLRGNSPYASKRWRFRYRALLERRDLTLAQLVERERRTGFMG